MEDVKNQIQESQIKIGEINDMEQLRLNLEMNCIPTSIFEMNVDNYTEFLQERRKLTADKIKLFYQSL